MAKYFLLVKIFSRGRGSRVTRAAAYRAGERIRDERTSESYNYSDRQDIVHTEIVLPPHLANSPELEWAHNRASLWNAVEDAGHRRNSRLAREVLVTLPPELPAKHRAAARKRVRKQPDDVSGATAPHGSTVGAKSRRKAGPAEKGGAVPPVEGNGAAAPKGPEPGAELSN